MRVLLIDDHEIVWNGTRRLLERLFTELDASTSLVFTGAREVATAIGLDPHGFDLVLLDYHLPGLSGLEALRAVKAHFEGAPVCMLSAESDPWRVRQVIEAGAAGFVPKSYGLDEAEAALRLVLRHRVFLPAEFVMSEHAARQSQLDELGREDMVSFLQTELSQRQRQVLALAMRGQPTKLISRQLGIAEGTVKVHLSMVYRALGVRNRTEALCRVVDAHAEGALDSL